MWKNAISYTEQLVVDTVDTRETVVHFDKA